MFVVTAIVTVALAAALAWSAARKLSGSEHVVATYTRVGVPRDALAALAMILLVGAVGLLAGLRWEPVGIAATTGVLCYFLVAVAAHVRARDTGNAATPTALAVLSAVALALRLATI